MSKSLRERVADHCAKFAVGDVINCFVDNTEVEAKIVSIDGHRARVELPWGTFSTGLSTAHKMGDES